MSRSEIIDAKENLKDAWRETWVKYKKIAIAPLKELPEITPQKEYNKPYKKEYPETVSIDEMANEPNRLVSAQKIDRRNGINWELLKKLGVNPDEVGSE